MASKINETNEATVMIKNFLAGGLAGMCSKTTVAPIDRLKILLQAQNRHYHDQGIVSGFRYIIKNESFFALYKGNGAQMVRIFPYAAAQFTSFEVYKKTIRKIHGKNGHFDKFLAGSMAGLTAVGLTYPLDMIRARLAFQITGEQIYTGIVHSAVSIFKNEGGVRALYRGFLPTIMGIIPYAGLSFYCFDLMKYFSLNYAPQYTSKQCAQNTGGVVLTVPAKLICGGLAGALAQSFSYPLDVTRRRMQLAMMNPETQHYGTSMFKTLQLIYRENGVVCGLYRGMSLNYLRAVPMVAVSFATYETVKQLLGVDTGFNA